jgi:copper chaperone CopZ
MANMQETFSLPTMFGDHHVVAVRQVVAALAGVTAIQASAARQKLVVTFDPAQLSAAAISAALTQAGFAPGQHQSAAVRTSTELPIVAAAEQSNVREAKYSPPPSFGVCPGLEVRFAGSEHPADR